MKTLKELNDNHHLGCPCIHCDSKRSKFKFKIGDIVRHKCSGIALEILGLYYLEGSEYYLTDHGDGDLAYFMEDDGLVRKFIDVAPKAKTMKTLQGWGVRWFI